MRQRQYLGPRYDCRMNAYDWDYHMKLVNKEVKESIDSTNITNGMYKININWFLPSFHVTYILH